MIIILLSDFPAQAGTHWLSRSIVDGVTTIPGRVQKVWRWFRGDPSVL